MYTSVNLFVFLVVLNRYISAPPNVRKPLIIEGFDCTPEDYPFLVSIRRVDNLHICGGSLVKENWVLTAGHCCHQRKAEGLFVSAGLHTKYSINDFARVKRIFVHPNFKKEMLKNDVCLILLETPIHPNRRISYVNLTFAEPRVELAKACVRSLILGFGNQNRISANGVNLEPNKSFDPRLKCAHLSGDSGGPLICNGSQIGIVSGGYGCGLPLVPSLFTRLDLYKDFILDTIRNNRGCMNNKTSSITFLILLLIFTSGLYF